MILHHVHHLPTTCYYFYCYCFYFLLTIFLLGSCMVKLTLEGKAPAQKDVSRPE